MRHKEFLYLFVKSLSPKNYNNFTILKKRQCVKYFLKLILILSIINALLIFPKFLQFPAEASAKISRLTITNIDIEISEPITFLNFPKIEMDLSGNATITDQHLLITKSSIFIRKLAPSLLDWKLYDTSEKPITEYSDILADFGRIQSGLGVVLVFLFPSIVFFFFAFNFSKYFIVFLISVLFALILRKRNLLNILKITTFALTILIIAELILKLFNLIVLAYILYFVFYYFALNAPSVKHDKSKKD